MEKCKGTSLPFSTLVTHELSGPVRGLRISLERLEADKRSQLNEESLKFLNEAVSSTKKIQQILERLTGIAESERSSAGNEDFDSLEAIETVLNELDGDIRTRGASVIVGVVPEINYERHQFETILLNLIGNALSHSESANLVIEIGATSSDGLCTFLVSDNGIGISAERQSHMFDPFLRNNQSHSTGRLGLGLFICKHLVEMNQGTIFVNSTLGNGTEFGFTIPLRKND
jgi:signal transduction histidine kinase